MKEILIESQYIGSCSYWHTLLHAEKIILDQHEHYEKRSYRNRAHILGANGLLRLSIPLERGKHQHSAMKDVRISYDAPWQKLHWQSFTSAYRRSPFFEYYEDHFRKLYDDKIESLISYNYEWMKVIASILKVELPVSLSEKYLNPEDAKEIDYRNHFVPNKKSAIDFPSYPQVFSDRFEFVADLCVLDVLFNLGNGSKEYLLFKL